MTVQENALTIQTLVTNAKNQAAKLWNEQKNVTSYCITGPWLRGFIEAEGSFFLRNGKPIFAISQHSADFVLLEQIKAFFGCGFIRRDRETAVFEITQKSELKSKLIPILEKGFIFSNKENSYNQWLTTCFPECKIPQLNFNDKFDNAWLIGFTEGDGSFYFRINRAPPRLKNGKLVTQSKNDHQIRCAFDLAQKDGQTSFEALKLKLFSSAKSLEIYCNKKDQVCHLRITAFAALNHLVKPLYSTNQLQSRKAICFFIWLQGLELMEKNLHTTQEGLVAFRKLDQLINEYRNKLSQHKNP